MMELKICKESRLPLWSTVGLYLHRFFRPHHSAGLFRFQGICQQQKQETRVPARVKKGTENIPEGINGKVTPAGNETIEVAGKKYDCELQDFSGEQQGNSFTGRVWKTLSIPGGVAKMTMEGKSADGQTMKVSMVVTAIDRK